MEFRQDFIDQVAERLIRLLADADSRKPFAAALFVVNQQEELVTTGRIVASGINTEFQGGNPNAHAEINVINMAAKVLFDA